MIQFYFSFYPPIKILMTQVFKDKQVENRTILLESQYESRYLQSKR